MKLQLLTYSNAKTIKGEKLGWMTAVLYLAPHKTGGMGNICPWASPGCIASCLFTAGRAGMIKAGESTNKIIEARKTRTRLLKEFPQLFSQMITADIERLYKAAFAVGMRPAIRLNGTSDLAWHKTHKSIIEWFPSVLFYDYTKSMKRASEHFAMPPNYHITYSISEKSKIDEVRGLLALGIQATFVYQGDLATFLERPPKRFEQITKGVNVPIVDGDQHDLIFKHPPGSLIALRAKGKAKLDTTGFVMRSPP